MRKLNRWMALVVLGLVWVGCTTSSLSTVTNLTASRLPRKASGQYMFSVDFSTRQRTLLADTLKAYVVVGDERYEMARTPLLRNRWEALVPVPATEDVLNYRYRFEYNYKAIPDIKPGVFDSKSYQLYLVGE